MEKVNTAKTMTHVCRDIVHQSNVSEDSSVVKVLLSEDLKVLLSKDLNVLLSTISALRKTCSSKLTLNKITK